MLPHEKTLVKRLESEPFALLGINSDGPADELRPRLESEGIAWRQAVDGSTEGPLAKAWNVSGWPTIYILDAEGRIRYRDLRDQAMEDAVMTLLAELKAAK
jgi:hypothetical protein